jgi:para-nitrobenzyl esterase
MPVYIYIHGGCFTFGSGSQSVFNGENLSKKGIVVVTINYRLNVFGFFGMKNMKKKINGKFTNTN